MDYFHGSCQYSWKMSLTSLSALDGYILVFSEIENSLVSICCNSSNCFSLHEGAQIGKLLDLPIYEFLLQGSLRNLQGCLHRQPSGICTARRWCRPKETQITCKYDISYCPNACYFFIFSCFVFFRIFFLFLFVFFSPSMVFFVIF